MDEKDLEKMTDEELKEFIKKYYAELDKKPDCASCPVTSCHRRRKQMAQEEEEFPEEDN
jgi:menaquinone-dependent protoporphyrinogen IX oxidase